MIIEKGGKYYLARRRQNTGRNNARQNDKRLREPKRAIVSTAFLLKPTMIIHITDEWQGKWVELQVIEIPAKDKKINKRYER